jgi:hypothetical protein
MTDTEIDTTVHETSALAWFIDNIHSLPFEGRSAVVDICKMVVQAANGDGRQDSDGRRHFSPVIEQHLVGHAECDVNRDNVNIYGWDPEFSGYGRAITNMSYVAVQLADELDTVLLNPYAAPRRLALSSSARSCTIVLPTSGCRFRRTRSDSTILERCSACSPAI